MLNLSKAVSYVVALALILLFVAVVPSKATVVACQASITPTSVTSYSENTFTITVQNTDSTTYNYIRIAPSSRFSIIWTNVGSWVENTSTTSVVLTGSTLAPSSSVVISVRGRALGGSASSGETWTVLVSDDGGSNTFSCTGTLGVAITAGGTDTYEPIISNISISEVTDTTAKVNWTTDEESDSVVYYGTTEAYGSTKSDSSDTTSHGVTVDGLSANTTYHFTVTSTDPTGNVGSENDYTFASSKQQQTVTTTVTTTTTTTQTKLVGDTTRPSSSITTDLTKVYSEAPEVEGSASDNSGVAQVYYSIDDGRNYLPAEVIGKIGSKSVKFSFTPDIIDDGNYKIKLKVIDSSGNESISKTYELVIDRLPPTPGGAVFSLGPMILHPDRSGTIYTTVGLDTRILLSSVGGAISLEVLDEGKSVSLVKNIENGLWSGILNFTDPGVHKLQVKGIDGAGNETHVSINSVVAIPPGEISAGGEVLEGAEVGVFVFNDTLRRFRSWNGQPYSQTNPQKTGLDGRYKLVLPNGKYYIEVKKSGFRPLRTQIFEITKPLPVNTHFSLNKIRFPWDLFATEAKVETEIVENEQVTINAAQYLPDFDLPDIGSISLLGKPGVLTVMSSWLPNSSEQMVELAKLSKEFPNVSVRAVLEQETRSKVNMFKRLGGYDVDIHADPDGKLFSLLNLSSLPSHIYYDRKGLIKKVEVGYLDTNEMAKNLLD